jgi:hypothetical protein
MLCRIQKKAKENEIDIVVNPNLKPKQYTMLMSSPKKGGFCR